MEKKLSSFCCGCTACKNVCPVNAISSVKSKKGFYVSQIDNEKCIGCGKCKDVCMCFFHGERHLIEQDVYAVQIKNNTMRMLSQSGGAYAALAENFLQEGGILYGVEYKQKKALYSRVDSKNGIDKLKGSKYIQADLGNSFRYIKNDLTEEKKVLFSGTPCYVDGLKRYLKVEKVSVKDLYTVDLVCHGVPSPQIFEEYLELLSKQYNSEITQFNFRNKLFGWRDHVCSYTVNGEQYFSKNFVNIFYSNLCLNEICYACPYSNMNRIGDISLGDYWGIENVCSKISDEFGTSLVIVNTEKGKDLFEGLRDQVIYKKTSVNECMQLNLKNPTGKPDLYNKFWNTYAEKGILPAISNYCGYRQAEEDFFKILGWDLYKSLFDSLKKEGIEKVLLYGVGITMWQMISFAKSIDIEIEGLLDRRKEYVRKNFFEYEVLDENELKFRKGMTIIICSKKKDSILAIKQRLYSMDIYKEMNIVDALENS